ncbi:MAG: NBR1-Ig-like domain-containing protein [Anaerolineaceae bacterium]|nr:NBR1-Ig-like domain-containing protein [Anaerolineaceae bacterium]
MFKSKLLLTLVVLLLLSSCTLPITPTYEPPPIPDAEQTLSVAQTLDAVRTEAALTVAASFPTNTPVTPTNTLNPTFTPLPSETGLPSLTVTTTTTATRTMPPTLTPTRTATKTVNTGPTPRLLIVGVEKNNVVTVRTDNFPARQIFTVRIGPFNNFTKDNVVTGSINSGDGGSSLVTIRIPPEYYDEDRLTIRMDSYEGYYAFNKFHNTTSGTVVYTATPVPPTVCEVSTSPSQYTTFAPNADFDTVWTVKNTSNTTWDKKSVDYKYVSGTEMQKYNKYYDMSETVDPGETVEIIVDMIAPGQKGTYTTKWAVVQGNLVLCNMMVTIVVQ